MFKKVTVLAVKLLPFIWLAATCFWFYVWLAHYYSSAPQYEGEKISHILMVVFGLPFIGYLIINHIRKSLINYLRALDN